MDFSTRMRALRQARQLSQMDLAERTGISNTLLSMIETGKLLPGKDYEQRIRAALGWDEHADAALAMLVPQGEGSVA